jgi:hypothetical protein
VPCTQARINQNGSPSGYGHVPSRVSDCPLRDTYPYGVMQVPRSPE